MKELEGKVIWAIAVNQDQDLLRFVTSGGDLIYSTQGDCCSESWFADIVFSYQFFKDPIPVESVCELEVPEWVNLLANQDKRTRQEYDSVYGYEIKLGHGENVHIIFRNSSNGCYYGWCELLDINDSWSREYLDGAVWTNITEDWRA